MANIPKVWNGTAFIELEAADQAAAAAANTERDAAEAARLAAKESARAKLAAIGLTEEEIAALVGA